MRCTFMLHAPKPPALSPPHWPALWLVLWLSVWCGVPAAAEDSWVSAPPHLTFTPLRVADGRGLPARVFLQDAEGFLWIGGERGLRRYDGYDLAGVVEHNTAAPEATVGGTVMPEHLMETSIVAMLEDEQGQLWVATADEVQRRDAASGAWTSVWPPAGDAKPSTEATSGMPGGHSTVTSLLLDSGRTLWVGTRQGLDELAPGGALKRHRRGAVVSPDPSVEGASAAAASADDASAAASADQASADDASADASAARAVEDAACRLQNDHITALHEDSQGTLWVGSQGGLYRLDRVRSCFQSFRHDPSDGRSLASDHVTALLDDSGGTLWVGTADAGLDRMLGADGQFFHLAAAPADALALPDPHVVALFEDSLRQLWVGTASGLSRLQPSTGRFDRYSGPRAVVHGLPVGKVQAIYEDSAGTLWVGGEEDVASLPALRRYLQHVALAGFAPAPSLGQTLAVYEDVNRRLWLGTAQQGLVIIDRQKRQSRRLWLAQGASQPGPVAVTAIAGDGRGEVWLGTAGAGVWWRHPDHRQGTEESLRPLPHGDRFPEIDRAEVADLATENADLWIATSDQGLFRFDPSEQRLESWLQGTQGKASLTSDRLTSVTVDRRGDVWVGSADGGVDRLRRSPPQGPAVESFGPALASRFGQRTLKIHDLHEDPNGVLWLATDGGLVQLGVDRKVMAFDARLGSRAIYSVVADGNGQLWIGADGGLWRLPLSADGQDSGSMEAVERFTVEHGLQNERFNPGAVFRSDNDEGLIFGGGDGINVFSPKLVVLARPAPRVVLSRVVVEGQARALARGAKEILLDSEERALQVEVAALDFVRPAANRYAFFLEGEDRGWVETGSERRIRYNALRPGDYTLHIAAAHADGVWNREALRLDVQVTPELRQRPAFRLLMAAAALLIVTLLVLVWDRARNRRQVRLRELEIEGKQRQLGAQEDERARLARQIHDGPLVVMTSLVGELDGGEGVSAEQGRLAADKLRRATVDLRAVSSRLHSPVLGRFGLAAAIRERLERLQQGRPRLEIQLDLAADGQRLSETVRLAMYRIFEQAVDNAVRHGDAGWIRVVFELSAGGCRLRVIDDGRGFRVPMKWVQLLRGKFQGLLDMVERAESVGGRCYIRSIPRRGTEVRVVAPLRAKRRARGRRRSLD